MVKLSTLVCLVLKVINNVLFKHYASHGLRLNERTKYELQNFDLGDIFHSVLKYISDRIYGDFKNLDTKNIQSLTKEALELILPKVQFNLLNSSAYYKYLSKRLDQSLKQL